MIIATDLPFRALNMIATGAAVFSVVALQDPASPDAVEQQRLWALFIMLLVGFSATRAEEKIGPAAAQFQLLAIRAFFQATLAVCGSTLLVLWISGAIPPVGLAAIVGLVTAGALTASHDIGCRIRRLVGIPRSFAIYGVGDFTVATARRLQAAGGLVRVVGFIDDGGPARPNVILPAPILGTLERFPTRLSNGDTIDGVILALPEATMQQARDLRQKLADRFIDVYVATPLLDEEAGYQAVGGQIGSLTGLMLSPRRLSPAEQFLKRSLDIVVATIALVLLAPLIAICAVIIKLESPGPVIYRQKRYTTDSHCSTASSCARCSPPRRRRARWC